MAAGEPLMAHAAFAVATQVLRYWRRTGVRAPGTTVLLIVGSGANGGDALFAGAHLARRGAAVHAALLTDGAHQDGLAAARGAGVRIHDLTRNPETLVEDLLELASRCAAWIDGIVGIGARGALREPLGQAVAALEHERLASPDAPFVVAVDVPSGVGVDDGSLPGPALTADLTVAMGALKPAHILPPAAAVAGRVSLVELGLLPGLLTSGAPHAARVQSADVADLWPIPDTATHKYSRGVLRVLAGSRRFPGAATLVCEGAHGTGLGMVRLEAPSEVASLVLSARPEVVLGPGRAQAHVVGPGLDEDDVDAMDRAAQVVLKAGAAFEPLVLDATGLTLLDREELRDVPPGVVLTPHAGELARILSGRGEEVPRALVEEAPGRYARLAAELTGATVVLKGPVTVVAAPNGPLYAQDDSTSWLATAGAGDVLSGVLGALLAGHGDRITHALRAGEDLDGVLARLSAAAVLVHGRAARLASSGGPISAREVAQAVSPTVIDILHSNGSAL